MVDFLFVIIELFCYLLHLRRNKWKSVKSARFERRWVTLSANFRWKGASHLPNSHCWCQNSRVTALMCGRLGFKTCLSKTKTKTQQFQDQDQDLLIQDQDFDVQDQDRDSRLTRPILEVHDWDELSQTKSHGKQKIQHTSSCTQ